MGSVRRCPSCNESFRCHQNGGQQGVGVQRQGSPVIGECSRDRGRPIEVGEEGRPERGHGSGGHTPGTESRW